MTTTENRYAEHPQRPYRVIAENNIFEFERQLNLAADAGYVAVSIRNCEAVMRLVRQDNAEKTLNLLESINTCVGLVANAVYQNSYGEYSLRVQNGG